MCSLLTILRGPRSKDLTALVLCTAVMISKKVCMASKSFTGPSADSFNHCLVVGIGFFLYLHRCSDLRAEPCERLQNKAGGLAGFRPMQSSSSIVSHEVHTSCVFLCACAMGELCLLCVLRSDLQSSHPYPNVTMGNLLAPWCLTRQMPPPQDCESSSKAHEQASTHYRQSWTCENWF